MCYHGVGWCQLKSTIVPLQCPTWPPGNTSRSDFALKLLWIQEISEARKTVDSYMKGFGVARTEELIYKRKKKILRLVKDGINLASGVSWQLHQVFCWPFLASGEFKYSLQVEIIIMDRVCLVADRATLHILSGHTHTGRIKIWRNQYTISGKRINASLGWVPIFLRLLIHSALASFNRIWMNT